MIEAKEIAFAYRNSRKVLTDISFTLGGGSFLALLGNNGAGKSTLLKCLNHILEPDQGVISVCGQDVKSLKRRKIAQTMAFVAQQNDVGQMTVFDTVLMGRKPYITINPSQEDLDITQNVIDRMELSDFALRYVDELSGGELQKVVIARALAQQPRVLLLDEPTSSLDLYNQHEVMRIAGEIAREDHILVIVVIHDINLALRYCDRFLFVKDGTVFAYGDSSVIRDETISAVYGVNATVREIDGNKIVFVDSLPTKPDMKQTWPQE